ncbi:SCO family protein [Polaromonas naphthalenivorans]|uniref:Electron transport protein SCO1/SenC n=1 Tax=Polaromonas naphthalenivorans (strain CJ2) TaxID=365044 RepID=A1VKM7_POLNA|nr:SCO family protein [Polaromonas naphthalenivorans]ABM36205.1 electron transport protein SCO1/SenC [Polaromonas naphthalenivorans CJ2]
MKTHLLMQPGRRRAFNTLAALMALSMSAGVLTGCAPDKPQFKSIDLTGADYAQGFSLADHNGQLRTLKDFAGKVVVVFFGFTQCPDVCPTSMAELAEIKKQLGADGDKLQAIFITVDPERDTPEMLKAYMGNFDPTFVALRPTPEQLAQVARDFKIYYKKVDGKTQGSYTMDHSAGSYIFDPQGRVRLYSRYGSGAEALASDIRLLIKSS